MEITYKLNNADEFTVALNALTAVGVAMGWHQAPQDESTDPARQTFDDLTEASPVTGSASVDTGETPPEEHPQVGIELDKNGTPWIEDVHASTKSKKADGTWTKKRGVDDNVLQAAEADARAKLADTPAPAPQAAPAPEVTPETVAPSATVDDLMEAFTAASAAGLIDAKGVTNLYASHGSDVNDILNNETALNAVVDDLRTMVENASVPAPVSGLPGASAVPGS